MDRAVSHRLQWAELPEHVQRWVEESVGAPVVRAEGQQGGYGPGMAARCVLSDGRRVFVKAVSPAQNPDTPNMMREEARINHCLPDAAPAPRVLHQLDDGEWVVLVFEDVDGRRPGAPWTDDDLRQVGDLSGGISALKADDKVPTIADRYARAFTGWRTLLRAGATGIEDPWCRRHVDQLAGLEEKWAEAVAGDALVHGDFRDDNVLLGTRRAYAVDWTATCRGVPWFDVLAMLPSVEVAGGGPPEHALGLLRIELDDDVLVPLVAAFAGYFARHGGLPDPVGLPTVRAFQRAQGEVTTRWLRRLVGWD